MTMQMNEMFYGGNEPHWLKNYEYQRPNDYMADLVHPTSGRSLPTHEFRVPMCCPKCVEKVREELAELDGVCEVFVDQVHERVTVTGFVDPFQALKKMKRIKKKSQFWDGPSSSSTSKYSSHKYNQSSSSHHKKPGHHSRHHESTVYRASPSQVSYNRQPRPRLNKFPGSYDDEISYRNNSSYDDREVSHRNKFYDDSELAYRPFNRKYYGAYDDQEISYRPANRFSGAYGDQEISYRPASRFSGAYDAQEISYRPASRFSGAYDDQEISYRPANRFSGAYDDEIAYRPRNQYNDSRYSSSLFSRSLPRYESVPPFAQEYYTEDPVEQYPFY